MNSINSTHGVQNMDTFRDMIKIRLNHYKKPSDHLVIVLPNPHFGGAEVTHHDMVFSIKGGGVWTAHGQPQYLRLDHKAYNWDPNVIAHEFGHSLSFDDFYNRVKYPTALYDEDGFEHKKQDIRSIMDSYSVGVTHMDKAMLLMAMEMSGTLGHRSRWVG